MQRCGLHGGFGGSVAAIPLWVVVALPGGNAMISHVPRLA